MLGIAICFNIFIGFKWKFMCTKICGSNLRSMSSGKVIHTQMLALVALPRIFFIFASFFSVLVPPSPLLSLSPLSFLSLPRLDILVRGHTRTTSTTWFFCHWLNCWSRSSSKSQSQSQSDSNSDSQLKQVHLQSLKQLKQQQKQHQSQQSLSIFQHRLSMSSLLQN